MSISNPFVVCVRCVVACANDDVVLVDFDLPKDETNSTSAALSSSSSSSSSSVAALAADARLFAVAAPRLTAKLSQVCGYILKLSATHRAVFLRIFTLPFRLTRAHEE